MAYFSNLRDAKAKYLVFPLYCETSIAFVRIHLTKEEH